MCYMGLYVYMFLSRSISWQSHRKFPQTRTQKRPSSHTPSRARRSGPLLDIRGPGHIFELARGWPAGSGYNPQAVTTRGISWTQTSPPRILCPIKCYMRLRRVSESSHALKPRRVQTLALRLPRSNLPRVAILDLNFQRKCSSRASSPQNFRLRRA